LVPTVLAKSRRITEYEFAGEVVDANGTSLSLGDQVFGLISPVKGIRNGQGALASYAFVSANDIVIRPPNVTPLEASGLACAGLTAYHAMFGIAKLEPGQTIFINGGSTSVGVFAIQLAKNIGCKIYASASGKNEQFVRDLGADEVSSRCCLPTVNERNFSVLGLHYSTASRTAIAKSAFTQIPYDPRGGRPP
jgi:NADPH:quinone reductase-like Zn-dependent oxidoreductase